MKWTEQGGIAEGTLRSEHLNNERRVWMQPPVEPGDGDPPDVAVFLDGEYYLTHISAPQTLRDLQREGALRPTWAVYVEAGTRERRWPESFCNARFADFLSEELVPAIEEVTGQVAERTLVGVSLSGLSATHAALRSPGAFDRVLSHSGSFWWNDVQLASLVETFPSAATRFRLTVGSKETDTDVDHGFGLIQVASQIAGCERMRDALRRQGFEVSYAVYDGGHDMGSWRRELASDLRALYSMD